MWRTKRIAFTVVAACAALAAASDARALCTAQEVVNAASGCPASSAPCTINTAITVNDGCTLDFGSRQVTLAAHLTIGAGMVTIKAGSFTINSSGLIDGKVNGGSGRGGSITIETTGDFTLQGGGSAIAVDATDRGGDILIDAGGNVNLNSDLSAGALNNNQNADGGTITIRAGGNVTGTTIGNLDARGGYDGLEGGDVDIAASGAIALNLLVTVEGGCGGSVNVIAGSALTVADIDASARLASDAGGGGCINLESGQTLTVQGRLSTDGVTGTFQSGGCGGFVCVESHGSNVSLPGAGSITADGAAPDGGGGEIAVVARGPITVAQTVSAKGKGTDGCGGGICVDSGLDIAITGTGVIDATSGSAGGGEGGGAGGDVEISADRDLSIAGIVDAGGKGQGNFGGCLSLAAGGGGFGSISVTGAARLDVAGSNSMLPGLLRRGRQRRRDRLQLHVGGGDQSVGHGGRRRRHRGQDARAAHDQRNRGGDRQAERLRRHHHVRLPHPQDPGDHGLRHAGGFPLPARHLHDAESDHAAVPRSLPDVRQRRHRIPGDVRRRHGHAAELRRLLDLLPAGGPELQRRADVHRRFLQSDARVREREGPAALHRAAHADAHPHARR